MATMAVAANITEATNMLEEGEVSLLKRGNIKGSFYGRGIKSVGASGAVFLTTRRIIFVPKSSSISRSNRAFWSERGNMISIRLAEITKHRFIQPLFGANAIYVRVPLRNGDEGDHMKCKLCFYSGGVGTFLAAFLRIMSSLRQTTTRVGGIAVARARPIVMQAEAQIVDDIRGGPQHPNDPTTVWVSDAIVIEE
jgi:hypothetical protein